jgi:hypothetical protein
MFFSKTQTTQSAFTPAARTTFPHLSISLFTRASSAMQLVADGAIREIQGSISI